jgi:capsular exopolysaccharide synthesis family protein
LAETPEESGARFNLGDIWAIVQMQRRVVLGFALAAVLLALVYSLVATKHYTARTVILLSTMAGQELRTDRVVDLDQYHRWNRQVFVQTQIEVLRSRALLTRALTAYEALGLEDGLKADDPGIMALGDMLEVEVRQGTELIDIAVTSPDPEQAARLANLVARTYQEANLDALTDAAASAKSWLEQQLAITENRITSASTDLMDYQKANDMADAEEEVTGLEAMMRSLSDAWAAANTEYIEYESMVRRHEKLLAQGAYEDLAKDINSTIIISLHQQYAQAVTEQAEQAAIYGPAMQQRRAADDKLATITNELRAEVETQISAERARLKLIGDRVADLREEIEKGKGDLLTYQARQVDYDKRSLELERAKELYGRMGQRMDELDLQAKTQLNNVRIVEDARPPAKPSSPKLLLNLVVGFVVGSVGGLGIGLLREYVDDTISSPLEVSTFLRVPFLGIIPKLDANEDERELALMSHLNPRSSVAEAVRGIRTVLELNPTGRAPQRMLVTSAVSSEGKTATTVRIGVAFANLGRRVLLVDGDLRRPSLHKIFGLTREPGLTGVLVDSVDKGEAIHHTEVPGLDVLPSGRGGERPNELLASAAMPRLLEELDELYDTIIVDSPPSVLLSDARILSRYVDGVVVLVREHATSRVLIREAILGLEQVGAKVLGVVVNAVDFGKHRTSYKYYYGYGYRDDRYDDADKDAAAK